MFRIAFGFLLAAETGGAILTGWVRRAFVEPDFTFTFIGFEWLRVFNGPLMYGWFALMAALGIAVMLGWRYRWSLGAFTLLWAGSYFMQKAHYNNHYYLLILLCLLMLIVPANAWASLDARRDKRIRSLSVPAWTRDILILLLGIVYTFAAIAKLQTDWLSGDNIAIWFSAKANYPLIGPLLAKAWMPILVAWGGFLFDLLIVPMLLWRRTRWLACILAIVFHIFNSAVFQIGIFPYLMIGTMVLFFPSDQIRQRFFPNKPTFAETSSHKIPGLKFWFYPLVIFFSLQIALPLRHHLIQGDVNWTEEGHRMSWRMMLRSKQGKGEVYIENPETGERTRVNYRMHISKHQSRKLFTHPDVAWQYAQWLSTKYAEEGKLGMRIYFEAKTSLNSHPYQVLIDPEVDMAQAKWSIWKRNEWVLDR
mgnify:CR=1 FL=1